MDQLSIIDRIAPWCWLTPGSPACAIPSRPGKGSGGGH